MPLQRRIFSSADFLRLGLASRRISADSRRRQQQDLLSQLQSLPYGTAEGCRRPLDYARLRLPALRRKYIVLGERAPPSHAHEDAPPPLLRGTEIDLRLAVLVNSVSTALEEYRALASVQVDEDDTAPSFDIDSSSADVAEAIAESNKAEVGLDEHIKRLEGIANPQSVTADNLKRQMRDARGLIRLLRVELHMPAFVPRWFRKTIDALTDYPKILRATAKAMLIGVDIARPLVDAYHAFEHGFYRLIIDGVERTANEFDKVASKWENTRRDQLQENKITERGIYKIGLLSIDRVGVTAVIMSRFAEYGVNINELERRKYLKKTMFVITTDDTTRAAISAAIDRIKHDGVINEPPVYLAIE